MATTSETFLTNFTGTWSLQSITARNTTTNGIIHPMGEVQGTLMYALDGYMCSCVQPSSLSNWSAGWSHPSEKEALESARGTQSYHGPFYVEEVYPARDDVRENDLGDGKQLFRRTIYHDIKTAQPPNWRGTPQKRLATLEVRDGKWHLTMRVEEDLDLGGLAGKEGKWRLEVRFVKAEWNEPGKGLPEGIDIARL